MNIFKTLHLKTLIYIVIIVSSLTIYKVVSSLYGKNKGYNIASNSLRALAWFYDMMLLHIILILFFCFYYLFQGVFKEKVVGYISYIVNEVGYGQLRSDWLDLEIKLFILYILYSFIFEAFSKKGTIGKRVLRIEFEQNMGVIRALVRNGGKVFSVLLLPVSLIISRVSSQRFWPHDLIFKIKLTKIFS